MITPDLLLQPFAAQAAVGDVEVVPQTSPTGFVNFSDGYTAFYEINLAANNPLAKAVERPIMNYLFNALSKNAQAWQYQGLPAWYPSKPGGYEKNAQVLRLSGAEMRPYRSLVAANVTDPLVSAASWEYVPFAAEALQNVPMPWGGMGAGQGPATAVISAAVDFNTLSNGTWVARTNAVAAACGNCPAAPNATALAGMLEARDWPTGAGAARIFFQRYSDIGGNVFIRYGDSASVWYAWSILIKAEHFQNGRMLYATTTGENSYSAVFNPPIKALVDGMEVRVKWGTANGVSASTLSLNGLPSKQIYGTNFGPLQVGSLVAGSLSTVVYSGSNDCFVLKNLVGGYVQGIAARNRDEVPNWGQVTDAINSAQPTSVPWDNITGKPNIVYQGSYATLSSLELLDIAPYIDFHYGGDASDYNIRLVNDSDKILRIFAKGNASSIAAFGESIINFNRPVGLNFGASIPFNQALNWMASDGNIAYGTAHNDTNWFLNYRTPAGATLNSLIMNRANGNLSFTSRPVFAGYTPWDNGNFNPANYVAKGANSNTNTVSLSYANGSDINQLTADFQGSLRITNSGNGTPVIGYLREGLYGAYLGLAANNQPFWGGWSSKSDGTQGYLVTSYNWGSWYQLLMPALAAYYVGGYMLAMQSDGGPAHALGELVSAAGVILCAVSGANFNQRPNAGTLRCMGYSQGSGVGQQYITLWQRVG